MSSKEQLIQTNQSLLLAYIHDKNLDSLLTLLHPEISIFGTAIHEKEELVLLEQLVKRDAGKNAAGSSDEGDAKIREICTQISELLGDIDFNIRKIHEHGSRADGIVKSMLMHSRGSNGNVQPTNLNELVREYTNLSFHGMRAGKDPIDVEIELDLYKDLGEIPLIAEDFSRVILNLSTNAFDAMKQKSAAITGRMKSAPAAVAENGTPSDYNPRLTVRTRKSSGRIIIEIEDNGPGIPDNIRDKIMQPFFTTKKGTQGTGLGLSITNDIVMAHGGTIQVESDLTTGSVFRVSLPAAMKAGITKP
ncbi:MAG: sensor histidine kinase [Cyclonatronaceae bacterium]